MDKMLICLAAAKDYFRESGANLSVGIQRRIASHFLKWFFSKVMFCLF